MAGWRGGAAPRNAPPAPPRNFCRACPISALAPIKPNPHQHLNPTSSITHLHALSPIRHSSRTRHSAATATRHHTSIKAVNSHSPALLTCHALALPSSFNIRNPSERDGQSSFQRWIAYPKISVPKNGKDNPSLESSKLEKVERFVQLREKLAEDVTKRNGARKTLRM